MKTSTDGEMHPARVTAAPSERDLRINELVRREGEFVWRVVRRFGVPEADAEDAVQEVFMVVVKRLDEYEERGAMRAWLVAIARQVALALQRSRFRHERRSSTLPLREVASDPQRALESKETVAFVNRFLAGIDQAQALVFYLAEVEGLSVPEIAGSLDVKLNTVYGRLHHARRRFEAWVRDEMNGDR